MNKKLLKILTNIILLISYMLTYFLDLTGLDLHQYLGIGAGLFLVTHIFLHRKWISQVSKRFFDKIALRVRVNYIIDLLLLVVITLIVISGILISTWLNLTFDNYPAMRSFHILTSVSGLTLLIIKLAIHWKYFATLLKPKNIHRRPTKPNMKGLPVKNVSRREALITIGMFSVVGVFGLEKALGALSDTNGDASLPDPQVARMVYEPEKILADEQEQSFSTDGSSGNGKRNRRGNGSSGTNDSINEELAIQAATPEAQPTEESVIAQTTEEPTNDECVVRCQRGCAYPGKCRRYIDENGNGLCDLGECLVL